MLGERGGSLCIFSALCYLKLVLRAVTISSIVRGFPGRSFCSYAGHCCEGDVANQSTHVCGVSLRQTLVRARRQEEVERGREGEGGRRGREGEGEGEGGGGLWLQLDYPH